MTDTTNIYISTYCKNESFLEVAEQMRKLGMPNWKDILRVKNKELCDISDVYQWIQQPLKRDDIDAWQQRTNLIRIECMENIWFFLREVLRVPVIGTLMKYTNSLQFELNLTNVLMILAYINERSFICLSPETQGISTTINALGLYTMLFHNWYYQTSLGKPDPTKQEIRMNALLSLNQSVLPVIADVEPLFNQTDTAIYEYSFQGVLDADFADENSQKLIRKILGSHIRINGYKPSSAYKQFGIELHGTIDFLYKKTKDIFLVDWIDGLESLDATYLFSKDAYPRMMDPNQKNNVYVIQ